MGTELLEIQPSELQFTFELKKQSSCSVHLVNKSDQYVAFKVKTTSPKKYCVRPNTGIIKLNATRDFTVTMQAQRVAPPDLQCKDKFLIQSIAVPFGTTDENITSDIFAKDSGRYIEEKKLKVALISPPPSPLLIQNNAETKQSLHCESSVQKDRLVSGVENIPPPHKDVKDVDGFETTKDKDEFTAAKDVEFPIIEDVEERKPAEDAMSLNLTKDFKELKSKLNTVDSKLKEADLTILKLTEERSMNAREKDMLKHQLEMLRKNSVKQVQVGFPVLYVFMIALISLAVGYLVHA
ncbi:vesicle-associated protein 1-2 isoform X2 [Ziziphus jujuba]|uniref:Vesicle-associated protein 1-2 isoform X2 n=1 Tax=Ziziphus jujuba TaxID=326968 RepID=A0ABM3I532_ZIZJJ|nr:vesicle-associated protein 1-2 isoform X2 [Ziziphus jujuba]